MLLIISNMHNLKINFDITKSFFQDSLNADGNYYFYPRNLKCLIVR